MGSARLKIFYWQKCHAICRVDHDALREITRFSSPPRPWWYKNWLINFNVTNFPLKLSHLITPSTHILSAYFMLHYSLNTKHEKWQLLDKAANDASHMWPIDNPWLPAAGSGLITQFPWNLYLLLGFIWLYGQCVQNK